VTAVQRSLKPGKASKPTARAASFKKAISWILLKDALALMANFYQDWWLAQQTLCKAFVEVQVRNRAARALAGWICEQGQVKEYEHNLQLSDLWRREYFAPNWTPYSKLQIHWQDNSATLETDVCMDARPVPVRFYRIEVAQEDLLKLLPKGYDLPQQQPAPGPQRKRGGGRREQFEWDCVLLNSWGSLRKMDGRKFRVTARSRRKCATLVRKPEWSRRQVSTQCAIKYRSGKASGGVDRITPHYPPLSARKSERMR